MTITRRHAGPEPDWAVVLSSPTEGDHYFGHFFATEREARALQASSKAGKHGFIVSLWRRVDDETQTAAPKDGRLTSR